MTDGEGDEERRAAHGGEGFERASLLCAISALRRIAP